jgi:glutamate---cysteine ligase / carboxylate-amine ligase
MPTMTEISTAAALSQCLVDWLDSLYDRGYTLPVPRRWVVTENKWRAARHGIEAEIIADEHGTLVPMRDAITLLVEELTPTARRLGCEGEVVQALQIVEQGPSYMRQRDVVASGGTLVDVVDSLMEELRTDQPRRIETISGHEEQHPRG